MKKLFYASALLVMLSPFARAEKQQVVEIIDSSFTVNVVAIGHLAAVQVDAPAILMIKRTFLSLQNMDPSYDMYCSEKPGVTSATGFLIPRNGTIATVPLASGLNYALPVKNNRLTIYCIGTNTLATSKLAVMQGY